MNFINKLLPLFLAKQEKIIKAIADYFAPKKIKIYWFASLGINLAIWILTALLRRGLKEDLAILHYNITFGIDSLGSPNNIFYLPLIGLIILLINTFFSINLMSKDKYLAYLLIVAAVWVNLIVGLGLYSLYLVNFVKIF